MDGRRMRWRLRADDLKSATLMLEYKKPDGSMGDVIAVPIDGMSPSLLVRLSNAAPGDMYDVIFESDAILYSPVSMSTVMGHADYDDVAWDDEAAKVSVLADAGRPARVSLSILRGSDDVFTMEFPVPTDDQLGRLLGDKD